MPATDCQNSCCVFQLKWQFFSTIEKIHLGAHSTAIKIFQKCSIKSFLEETEVVPKSEQMKDQFGKVENVRE